MGDLEKSQLSTPPSNSTSLTPRAHPSTPHFVVIGIDFGTTYSGVSWTCSNADRPDQINTVHKWDAGSGSGRNQQADKVPSKLAYDSHGKVLKWGYGVSPRDENQVQWFKLLLSEDADKHGGTRVKETKAVLKRLGKKPATVVADYLRCLWLHAVEDIELSLSKIAVENMAFRVVLTVPASWDHEAQALTKTAAHLAGIDSPRNKGPTIFRLVSEPEAAALAAWKDSGLRWRPDLSIGDTFVVCDAGGGTVDLISYRIDSLDPIRLSMCVEATGDLCGAIYLDEGFDRTMRTLVGSTYDKLNNGVKAKVFENDWEYGPKRKYVGPKDGPQEFAVDIPGYQPKKSSMFGKRPSSTIVLKDGYLSSIFQPVVSKIVDLVRNQVYAVMDETEKAPKVVLLVGGFGENDFVLDQLKNTFSKRCSIQRPVNAWGAISRGAVFKGLNTTPETEVVTNFITNLNYGIRYAEYFEEGVHEEADRRRCPYENVDLVQNQVMWYLRRGQSVEKLAPVTYSWAKELQTPSSLEKINDSIWVSSLQEPPTKLGSGTDVRSLCQIDCSFDPSLFYELEAKKSADGKLEYREIEYTIEMKVAAGELEWAVNYAGQQKGKTTIKVEYMSGQGA